MVPYTPQVAGGLGQGLRPFSGSMVRKKTGARVEKAPWFPCSACGELFGTAGTRNSHMQNLCRVVAKWRNQQVIDCDAGDFMPKKPQRTERKVKKEEPSLEQELRPEERSEKRAESKPESHAWKEKERGKERGKEKGNERRNERGNEKGREKAREKAKEKAKENDREKDNEKDNGKEKEITRERETKRMAARGELRGRRAGERDSELESDEEKLSGRLQAGKGVSKEKLGGTGVHVKRRRRINFFKLVMRRSGAGGKYQKRKSPSSQNLVRLVATPSDGDDPTPPQTPYTNPTASFARASPTVEHPFPSLPSPPAALAADPFDGLTKVFCHQVRLAGHTVARINVLEVPMRCRKPTGLMKVYLEDPGFRAGRLLYEQELGEDTSMFRKLPTESRCVGTLMMAKKYSEELGGLGVRVRVLIVLQRRGWADSKRVRSKMLGEKPPDVDIVRGQGTRFLPKGSKSGALSG